MGGVYQEGSMAKDRKFMEPDHGGPSRRWHGVLGQLLSMLLEQLEDFKQRNDTQFLL